jgi:adenylosuccinate synthase
MTRNKLSTVVGGQYGSEGKGAIAGHLTRPQHRNVTCIRVGGPNAGHTVLGNGPEGPNHPWRLRTIPVAAVTNPDAQLVIAPGSEIDTSVLFYETELLEDYGYKVWDRLHIDPQATMLDPLHIEAEQRAHMHEKIGSTAKGIGAARADRIMRTGRIWADATYEHHRPPVDTAQLLQEMLRQSNNHIVIEGTQGYGLGLHAGHYPQCTSNDARAIDFLAMAGINPWDALIDEFNVIVIARAYPIRVAGNSGPLKDETTWQELGLDPELTTVTRKVRRVGQWDPSIVAAAVQANGGAPTVTLALTMVDHMFPEIAGKTGPLELLPEPAQKWVDQVAVDCKAEVSYVGTGPATVAGGQR